MARMATNENPDIRFSAFVAVAKRGANTQKKATIAAKNRMSAAVAGRRVMACRPVAKAAAAHDAAARSAAEDYQR